MARARNPEARLARRPGILDEDEVRLASEKEQSLAAVARDSGYGAPRLIKAQGRWVAEVRSRLPWHRSLRRLARVRLRQMQRKKDRLELLTAIVRNLLAACSRPIVLPVVLPASVVVLAILDKSTALPALAPNLPAFNNPNEIKQTLSLLWQIEGTILALVTAVILFAFEGLSRSRPEISVWEYAGQSGLAQYLMLGAAGLIAVPIALYWSPEDPPASAVHAAGAIAFLGIIFLPWLLYRATKVVDPAWLRARRLREVSTTATELVKAEVLEQVALKELHTWAQNRNVQIRYRLGLENERASEVAAEDAVVFDIDLSVLGRYAKGSATVVVHTRLGERVSGGTLLIAALGDAIPRHRRPACLLIEENRQDRMGQLLRQLREEASEAIRSESVAAIESVAQAYIALWLAWPTVREAYGQRLGVGFMAQLEPFRLTPVGELRRHLFSLLESAVQRQLREHALTLTGILWKVGRRSIELYATDILTGICDLARSLLRNPGAANSELQVLINERAWLAQVELCDVVAGRLLIDKQLPPDQKERATKSVEILFRSIAESLKILFELHQYSQFEDLDNRFTKLLRYWHIGPNETLARRIVTHPNEWRADEAEVQKAALALKLHDIRRRLLTLRNGLRLSVVAWMLHRQDDQWDEQTNRLVLHLIQDLGTIGEVTEAVGVALASDTGILDRWLIFEHPHGEVRIIDSEGPILRAFALRLFCAPSVTHIPAAPWINGNRATRLKAIIGELADSPVLGASVPPRSSSEFAAQLTNLVDAAVTEQRNIEMKSLVAQSLDQSKVDLFRQSVLKGWQEDRMVPELLRACSASITRCPIAEWGNSRIRIGPQFEPKGLFVTPSNWGGLEYYGRELGRAIAVEEVDSIVLALIENANKIRGRGDPLERVRFAVEKTAANGYLPTLILVPPNYRLLRALDLDPWGQTHSGTALDSHLCGQLLGLPVLEWSKVPDNRVIVADLANAVEVEEAIDAAGNPALECEVTEIDDELAHRILSTLPTSSDETDEKRLARILTSVRVSINRPYKVRIRAGAAAVSIWIPAVTNNKS